MVKVTAAEVNKLRKTTGAGMMDCKKALVEAEGSFDTAIEILRKKVKKLQQKELTENHQKELQLQLLMKIIHLELELY